MVNIWLYGYHGYLVIWLYGYLVMWLHGYLFIWLSGYLQITFYCTMDLESLDESPSSTFIDTHNYTSCILVIMCENLLSQCHPPHKLFSVS